MTTKQDIKAEILKRVPSWESVDREDLIRSVSTTLRTVPIAVRYALVDLIDDGVLSEFCGYDFAYIEREHKRIQNHEDD